MNYEVEQKYPVDNLAAVEAQLAALGAEIGPPEAQSDEYFRHPTRDFAETDEAFRIRRVAQANCLTYKGPKIDRQSKTRREIEVSFADGSEAAAQMQALVGVLGFESVAEVAKIRRNAALRWQGVEVTAALDQIAGLGDFIELELIADEAGLDAARQGIASLASELGLASPERRSYLELLLQSQSPG